MAGAMMHSSALLGELDYGQHLSSNTGRYWNIRKCLSRSTPPPATSSFRGEAASSSPSRRLDPATRPRVRSHSLQCRPPPQRIHTHRTARAASSTASPVSRGGVARFVDCEPVLCKLTLPTEEDLVRLTPPSPLLPTCRPLVLASTTQQPSTSALQVHYAHRAFVGEFYFQLALRT